ncbi:FtsX-like permease family protein [Dactylosporangium sp. AC04546]|uniref:FtsX-like permease family protein n=1 Tax=Dactylosporangium sp. AC04546 TaxID=2862460 RepID=UPI001EDD6BF7|nr:FtsX-like permease family protein [Dactylosporangium sp. AC04546]WVK88815.1 FtsX-like permease family protein [Dactylosporangium sp. AC04546]
MSIREATHSWQVAVRIARRSAKRSKARTLLIVLMLALPVYAGSVIALSYAATYTSADAEAGWRMGRADYEITGEGAGTVLATLPDGSRTVPVTYGRTAVRAGDTYSLRDYAAADVDAPLTRGMFVIRDGRAPRGPGEVAVSATLATALGIRVGDRLTVGLPLKERTVVGVIDAARELSIPLVITPADQRLSGDIPHMLVQLPPGGAGWTPPDPSEHMSCQPAGGGGRTCVSSFSTLYRGDVRPSATELATRTAAFVLVVGFAGTQVALLAGAAFAIGARRQRRELAMMSAIGAGRSQVARMVLANGLVLGAFAGISGVALGALTYWLNRDVVERIANHPLTPGAVPVPWLAAIALFAVAVGLLAALGPARAASRPLLRAALAGREAAPRASNLRWVIGGMLLAAAGAAIAVHAAGPTGSIVTVTAGTMMILLGVTAFAPVLVAAAGRLARRFPPAVRLAARHAARHRLRTAASAAAVCTAVAGSMALMLYNAAESTQSMALQPNARTGQVLLPAQLAAHLTPERLREVERTLPTRGSVPLTVLADRAHMAPEPTPAYGKTGVPALPSQTVAVGGAALIRAVTGTEAPPAALVALHDGGAVVFYPSLTTDGMLTIGAGTRLPAVLVPAPDYYTDLPGAVVSEQTVHRLGLQSSPGGVVIDTTRAPTPAEIAAANSRVLAAQLEADPSVTDPALAALGVKPVLDGRDYSAMFLVLAVVSGIVTLAAGAVAVGLATSEMRDDLSTLAAVGADPRMRRRIAAAQAGLLVGVGTLLGMVGGIAPAAGMVAFRRDLEWHVPWLPLTITVLVTPVVAVVATALLTRPRLVLVRRTG